MARKYCEGGLAIACDSLGEEGKFNGGDVENTQALKYLVRGCELSDPRACEAAIELAPRIDANEHVEALHAVFARVERERCHEIDDWVACRNTNDSHYEAAALHDCNEGELLACVRLASRESERLACLQYGYDCDKWLALTTGLPEQHDALEFGCQWRDVSLCEQLVAAYRAKTYVEPVAGRADDIELWLKSRPTSESHAQ